jgi:hypothetical protein
VEEPSDFFRLHARAFAVYPVAALVARLGDIVVAGDQLAVVPASFDAFARRNELEGRAIERTMILQPLLKSEWAVWLVEGGREPGAANP